MTDCPHCGRSMPEMREGVRLTKRQAEIYDAIKRRGDHPIQARELGNRSSVKSQIYLMRDNGIDIGSIGGRHDGGYFLRKRR